jgi:hypothetical protein
LFDVRLSPNSGARADIEPLRLGANSGLTPGNAHSTILSAYFFQAFAHEVDMLSQPV